MPVLLLYISFMARILKKRGSVKDASALRYLLIVNPNSGQGRHSEHLKYVTSFFKKRDIPLDVRLTEGPGHATKIARDAEIAGYDVIIGAGGDGTINEVLNGLSGNTTKLAILPWGTGNVFALEMGYPRALAAQCKIIIKGKSLKLDLGLCGKRRFLLMCGAGFDAYSLRQIEGLDLKRRAGMFAYVLGGIRAFSRYHYPEIQVKLADGTEESCRYALISNTSRYGAFFSLSPQARPTDGLLDVFLYKEKGAFAMLRLVFRVLLSALGIQALSGPSPFLKKVALYRTTGLSLTSAKNVQTQIDGDVAGLLPIDISVLPAAVECILPAQAIKKMKGERRAAAILSRLGKRRRKGR